VTDAFDTLPMFSSTNHNIMACIKFGLLLCVTLFWHYSIVFKKVLRHFICSQSMAIIFWDSEGVVLCDYLEHGNTVTGA